MATPEFGLNFNQISGTMPRETARLLPCSYPESFAAVNKPVVSLVNNQIEAGRRLVWTPDDLTRAQHAFGRAVIYTVETLPQPAVGITHLLGSSLTEEWRKAVQDAELATSVAYIVDDQRRTYGGKILEPRRQRNGRMTAYGAPDIGEQACLESVQTISDFLLMYRYSDHAVRIYDWLGEGAFGNDRRYTLRRTLGRFIENTERKDLRRNTTGLGELEREAGLRVLLIGEYQTFALSAVENFRSKPYPAGALQALWPAMQIASQLRNNLQNTARQEKDDGGTQFSDFDNGISNSLIWELLSLPDNDTRTWLRSKWGNTSMTAGDRLTLEHILISSGVLEKQRQRINQYATKLEYTLWWAYNDQKLIDLDQLIALLGYVYKTCRAGVAETEEASQPEFVDQLASSILALERRQTRTGLQVSAC